MFTKVSVLVPTRRRLGRLQQMLASYTETVDPSLNDVELVFRVDDDDLDTLHLLADTLSGASVVVGPRLLGYRSMPVFFNEMHRMAVGDVFMCGNDDMLFRTTGWPALILAKANEFPDGVFDIGVSTHNETHYPFSIVSRLVTNRLGFLWDPRIFWGDIFLRDTMAAHGRCVMLPEVHVDHDWVGHAPDQTFLEGTRDVMHVDPTYWTGTHPLAVSEAAERLRGIIL